MGWTKRPPPEPEVEEKSAERTRLYSSPIIYVSLRSRSPGLHCSELEFGFVPAWCPRGARWVPRFVTQGSSRLRRAPSREVTPSLTPATDPPARAVSGSSCCPKKWLSPAKAVSISVRIAKGVQRGGEFLKRIGEALSVDAGVAEREDQGQGRARQRERERIWSPERESFTPSWGAAGPCGPTTRRPRPSRTHRRQRRRCSRSSPR